MIQLLGVWAVITILLAWKVFQSGRTSLGALNGSYELQYYRLPDGIIEWGPHPELGEPTWRIETATRTFAVRSGAHRILDEVSVYRSPPVGPKPYPTNVFLRHAEAMDAQARSGTWAESGEGNFGWQDEHQAAAKWGAVSRVHWHWSGVWRWIGVAASIGLLITAGLLPFVQAFSWFIECVREKLASRARRQASSPLCHQCGYSRVGLPEHNPCPECGKMPITSTAPATPIPSPDPSAVACPAAPQESLGP